MFLFLGAYGGVGAEYIVSGTSWSALRRWKASWQIADGGDTRTARYVTSVGDFRVRFAVEP